jgi:hypothetical protein
MQEEVACRWAHRGHATPSEAVACELASSMYSTSLRTT